MPQEPKWELYCWDFLKQFGKECYRTWRQELYASLVVAFSAFFIARSTDESAWANFKIVISSTFCGLVFFAILHFLRAAWFIHLKTTKQEQPNEHWKFGIIGVTVIASMIGGVLYLTAPLWFPKKHRHAFSNQDPQYIAVANTVHIFKNLASATNNKKCLVRLTAPPENREVVQILHQFADSFCDVEELANAAAPIDEILRDSEDDAITVHMAKEDPRAEAFMSDMGNVFRVARKYELPADSPAGLIWLQVGRGYPWKAD